MHHNTKAAEAKAIIPDTASGHALREATADTGFFQFPNTTVMVCLLSLSNGTNVVGVNHGSVNSAEYDRQQAMDRALQDAVNKALPFFAFAERERQHQANMAPAYIDVSGLRVTDQEFADVAAAMRSAGGGMIFSVSPMVTHPGVAVSAEGHQHKPVREPDAQAAREFAKGDKVVCIDASSNLHNETLEVIAKFGGWIYASAGGRDYQFDPRDLMHAAEFERNHAKAAEARTASGPYKSPHGWTAEADAPAQASACSGCGGCGGSGRGISE